MTKGSKILARINIRNKKASFTYELLEKYVAGMVLTGSEIKSIRQGKASLQEAYCVLHGSELFIRSMNVSRYKEAGANNHDPLRERKLLLNKQELKKIRKKLDEKGLTVVPLKLFINDRGLAKLEVSLAKGKKVFDKRNSIKERDQKRELDRLKV